MPNAYFIIFAKYINIIFIKIITNEGRIIAFHLPIGPQITIVIIIIIGQYVPGYCNKCSCQNQVGSVVVTNSEISGTYYYENLFFIYEKFKAPR